jgi:hypothetical protein
MYVSMDNDDIKRYPAENRGSQLRSSSNGHKRPADRHASADDLGLYSQATKRIRWMPWQSEAMKDVVACEKLRGVGKQTLIRRCPNGETHLVYARYPALNT